MKKKIVIIALVATVLAGGCFIGYKYVLPNTAPAQSADDGNTVSVTSVADIVGSSAMFAGNRYSGVVETQEVVAVKADSEKTIKETYVEPGDVVKKGDKLFEYDVDEMKNQLAQDKLDLEQTQSEITSYNTQIESLEKEKNNINANNTNQQLSLTNQIEALKLELKKANYTVETKTKEIEKLEKSIKNCVVKSTVDGKVQSVGEGTDSTAENKGYVNIASDGDYRIKALVSEENIYSIYEDAPVLIRSRVDERTWTGTVSSIDTAAPEQSTDPYGEETTTKYPVYISLDNTDGLLVGQHVTVELDFGQTEVKDGLWLDDYYIINTDDGAPFVWCGTSGKLEKRTVELGEYDAELMKYEILSGLTEEDSIAFPEERLTEGMTAVEFSDEQYIEGDAGYDGEAVNSDVQIFDENGNVIDDAAVVGDGGTVVLN